MSRAYVLHDREYRKMEAQGVMSWSERTKDCAVDADHLLFFTDVLGQSWCPPSGRVLEIGCGTAPMLQWFAKHGYSGMGIDVSRAALRMARKRAADRGLIFRHADVCRLDTTRFPKFQICLDGLCFHCLTVEEDRRAMLANVKALLATDGIFIMLSMCAPVDRQSFRRLYSDQIMRDHRVYVPFGGSEEYEGDRLFAGRRYIATRSMIHWKEILRELRQAGFTVQLVRINRHTPDEPNSSLAVCASVAGSQR